MINEENIWSVRYFQLPYILYAKVHLQSKSNNPSISHVLQNGLATMIFPRGQVSLLPYSFSKPEALFWHSE